MYNKRKYRMVEVTLDKHDYCLEDMIEVLPPQLYEVKERETKDTLYFKGLMRLGDIRFMETLMLASPYVTGYDNVLVEGINLWDSRSLREDTRRFWERKGF